MDIRLGLKTFEQINEDIDCLILKNPEQIKKLIKQIEMQIKDIDNELRMEELELKHGHTLKKTIEFDFYKNLIQYTEKAPDGTIILQRTRGFKPRDKF
jgi:hypothetical protein